MQFFNLWPQARFHTQWPGNGTAGDPIFDEFFRSTVQAYMSEAITQQVFKPAAVALMDKIGVSHLAIYQGNMQTLTVIRHASLPSS